MNRQVCTVKTMAATKVEKTVRDRLLEAADELFYAEGIHTVGIDRVIEKAGVAKASLYGTFGSKDELVRAYLKARADARRARIEERMARHDRPRDKILSVFDLLAERAREPSFRGCAFVNATAEGPIDCKVRPVALESRAWVRDLFTRLAAELGVADAGQVGRRLQVLYDGAMTAASMERDHEVIADAHAMAEALLDATTPTKRPARRSARRQDDRRA
jgi:AcrR family transcriptional regulator